MLKGKKALITGAGKGIGRSISLAYAENGAELCLVSRTKNDLEELASEIRSRWESNVVTLQGDVSDPKSTSLAFDAIKLLGGVDVLVCAAGFPFQDELWNKPLHELNDADFERVLNVDLLGSFRFVKGVLPQMVQQKQWCNHTLFIDARDFRIQQGRAVYRCKICRAGTGEGNCVRVWSGQREVLCDRLPET